VSKPAWIAVIVILAACLTVDVLDRNLKDPQVPALFYGVIAAILVWGIDRMLRTRRERR
jgi:hypothetical protein